MEVYFSIAFVTGLASSLHCIGMCGPIALALPVGRLNNIEKILAKLLYNSGRILTYSLLGLFFGYFGKQFFIAGWQQIVSI
jgi:sulfite exporter TauE/SafE